MLVYPLITFGLLFAFLLVPAVLFFLISASVSSSSFVRRLSAVAGTAVGFVLFGLVFGWAEYRVVFHGLSQVGVLPIALALIVCWAVFSLVRSVDVSRRWSWLIVACLIPALLYSTSKLYWEGWQTRYRMTIEVETPDGPKTGSSVIEVGLWTPRFFRQRGPHGTGRTLVTKGVTPIVDMGRHGTLLASVSEYEQHRFKDGYWIRPPLSILTMTLDPQNRYPAAELPVGKFTSPIQLSTNIPQLIWMPADAIDRFDAVAVLPKDLEKTIALGVKLKSITIEPTGDPVVEQLPDPPNWYVNWRVRYLAERERLRAKPSARPKRITIEQSKKYSLGLKQLQSGEF